MRESLWRKSSLEREGETPRAIAPPEPPKSKRPPQHRHARRRGCTSPSSLPALSRSQVSVAVLLDNFVTASTVLPCFARGIMKFTLQL